jgi:DNA-binding transcriptional MerR regulator
MAERSEDRKKDLPDKLYYTIREVSQYTEIEPHVLRYWESEFPSLRPKRNRSGSRAYKRKDIDEIEAIRQLLHEEGYRIEGARKTLRERKKNKGASVASDEQITLSFDAADRPEKIARVRKELQEILDLLKTMRFPDDDGR